MDQDLLYTIYLRRCTCIYELFLGEKTRVPGFDSPFLEGKHGILGVDSCPFWAAAQMHKTSPSLQWIFTGLPPFSEGASEQHWHNHGKLRNIIGILGEVRHIMVKPPQFHGSLNVPIEHHPTIRYMVYNGYYKVMSNIPKMGQLPTPDNS